MKRSPYSLRLSGVRDTVIVGCLGRGIAERCLRLESEMVVPMDVGRRLDGGDNNESEVYPLIEGLCDGRRVGLFVDFGIECATRTAILEFNSEWASEALVEAWEWEWDTDESDGKALISSVNDVGRCPSSILRDSKVVRPSDTVDFFLARPRNGIRELLLLLGGSNTGSPPYTNEDDDGSFEACR